MSYDSRLQATTIEEALYEFPDFVNYATGNKPLVEKEPTPPLLGSSGRGRIGAAKASVNVTRSFQSNLHILLYNNNIIR